MSGANQMAESGRNFSMGAFIISTKLLSELILCKCLIYEIAQLRRICLHTRLCCLTYSTLGIWKTLTQHVGYKYELEIVLID